MICHNDRYKRSSARSTPRKGRKESEGDIAAALEENAGELLAEPPQIEEVDVIEAKLL